MLDREIARAGGGRAAGPGIALQSEVDRERQLGAVRADTDIDKAGRLAKQTSQASASKMYQQLTAAIPQARELLKKATGSGAGAMMDGVNSFFGRSTESSEAAGQLETLSGWMMSNVPRIEGPQSDADRKNYMMMAAMVGDRSVPVAIRLKSLDTLETLQQKYADINNVMPEKKDAAPAVMMEMPKPNAANKGRIMRDTETGKRYQSNGLQWKEVN